MAHGEVYAEEFGWDASFEALVARIVADYAGSHDARREAAWIAVLGGRRVGCIFCLSDPDRAGTALLRILLVHPDGRGRDLGRRLLDTCLEFAREAGYGRVRLWTNHPLAAARHLYLERGFRLLAEEPHHSFGVDLVGQTYELDLGEAATGVPARRGARREARRRKRRSLCSDAASKAPQRDSASAASSSSSAAARHRASAQGSLPPGALHP